MKIVLTKDLFINNVYSKTYSNKKAEFTIIDEALQGTTGSYVVDRVICVIDTYANDGSIADRSLGSMVIGLGDGLVGAYSADITLAGKLMTQDNMASCTVELYE